MRWITKLVIWLLKNSRLGNEDRQLLTAALLTKLGALPVRARITADEVGKYYVDGRELNLETAQKLRETSKAMLHNFARRFVREQVTFMAIKMGVHENTSPEQGLFAKSALWNFQEEDELYRKFAGEE